LGVILFSSQDEKNQLEARNVILQYDYVVSLIKSSTDRFTLTVAIIQELHRLAIHDIYACAGSLRTVRVTITKGIIYLTPLHPTC
jgi:fido (protein-threonine AMPylation protein)